MNAQAFNQRYLSKLASNLFKDPVSQKNFINCFTQTIKEQTCLVWTKQKPLDFKPEFKLAEFINSKNLKVDTVLGGYPGQSSWHDQGYFYLLDFSSVMAGLLLEAIPLEGANILDLCASPGGKSILAYQILQPSLLVCNESINSRIRMLISNLKRCDLMPCGVWSAETGYLARKFPQSFDVIIVDAPCSGQSLLLKGEKNPGAFNPLVIKKNASRQKKILSHACNMLKPGGYLAYMTCTYAMEENEYVIDWLLEKNKDLKTIPVPSLNDQQSHLVSYPAYRIWPQENKGAGSFSVLLKKDGELTKQETDFPYIWKNGI